MKDSFSFLQGHIRRKGGSKSSAFKSPERQVTTSQEVTIYQLPEASQSTAGPEYILTIPETQAVSSPVVQPQNYHRTACYSDCEITATIGASISTAQPYVVLDDQQPWTSRQMIFNPPSVAPSQQESQHNTSGLSSLFTAALSVLTYQTDGHTTAIFTLSTSTSTITSAICHSS